MNRDELLQKLLEQRSYLAQQYDVASLALFGSAARDEMSESSDIDLLVTFDEPVGLFHLFALQDELEEMLGRPVDIGTTESLKPRIRQRVLSEAVYVA